MSGQHYGSWQAWLITTCSGRCLALSDCSKLACIYGECPFGVQISPGTIWDNPIWQFPAYHLRTFWDQTCWNLRPGMPVCGLIVLTTPNLFHPLLGLVLGRWLSTFFNACVQALFVAEWWSSGVLLIFHWIRVRSTPLPSRHSVDLGSICAGSQRSLRIRSMVRKIPIPLTDEDWQRVKWIKLMKLNECKSKKVLPLSSLR